MDDGGWERGEAEGRRGRSSVVCGEGVGSSEQAGLGAGWSGWRRSWSWTGMGEVEQSRLHRGRDRKKVGAIGVEGVELSLMEKYEGDSLWGVAFCTCKRRNERWIPY